jgi:hypothetical protein
VDDDDDEDKAEGEDDYGNEGIIIMKTWMKMAIIRTDDLKFFRFWAKAMIMTEVNDSSFDDDDDDDDDDDYYYYYGSTALCWALAAF